MALARERMGDAGGKGNNENIFWEKAVRTAGRVDSRIKSMKSVWKRHWAPPPE